MKIIKYILSVAVAASMTACTDWNDHYESSASEGSDMTLFQQMEQRPELSDFREVLQNTMVFRQHKKTSVSYAELLGSGQSFTVIAPVNGTFNKDSLIELTATNSGDSLVEKFFVGNHIARSANSALSVEQKIRLLNVKKISLGSASAEGVPLRETNIHARNGVLHVAEGQLPYRYSLYEGMTDIPYFKPVGDFIRLYDEDYFDENSSVSSGTVDGVPVYVDSVIVERNRLLESVGLLASEDSTYWMVMPRAEGWNKAYEEASRYFVYDSSVEKRDSLARYWTNRALFQDAIYSMTVQSSPNDSLKSVQYRIGYPKYSVFYKPFEAGGILSNVVETTKCSNGVLYQTEEWPFTPLNTYFQEILTEGEYTGLITSYEKCTYNPRSQRGDSISRNAYLDIVASGGTDNWSVVYRIANTLAGKYDICAVVLPKSVAGGASPDVRPCKFKAAVSYVDEKGKSLTYNCGNTQFTTNPLCVDTVVLAENFQFPVCNFGKDDIKVTVKINCSILPRENSKYNREMYLDCIYLRPRYSKE